MSSRIPIQALETAGGSPGQVPTVNAAGTALEYGPGGSTDPEVVRDTIAAALVEGSGVSISVNDAGDSITISATGGYTQRQTLTAAAGNDMLTLGEAPTSENTVYLWLDGLLLLPGIDYTFESATEVAFDAALAAGAQLHLSYETALAVVDPAILATVTGYSYTNPSPTGLVTLVNGNDPAEYVISGMDATGLTSGLTTSVVINLWEAMHDPGTPKGCIARLRDGGITGTVLASNTFGDAGDSTGGHQQQWSYSASVTPATTQLCVTMQQTNGTPLITSDTRQFTVTQ